MDFAYAKSKLAGAFSFTTKPAAVSGASSATGLWAAFDQCVLMKTVKPRR